MIESRPELLARLPDVRTIDAWTREDEPANGWYAHSGFEETCYLHIFATSDTEVRAAIRQPVPRLTPARVFLHADIDSEALMREQFARVYVCRRYERPIIGR